MHDDPVKKLEAPEARDATPQEVIDYWRQWAGRGGRLRQFLPPGFPVIVCLCGSARFGEAYAEANLRETCAGRIVLSVGCNVRTEHELWPNPGLRAEMKAALDELHLRKIELADEVLILNVNGYIGESTARELSHAIGLGKRIRFLEPQPGGG